MPEGIEGRGRRQAPAQSARSSRALQRAVGHARSFRDRGPRSVQSHGALRVRPKRALALSRGRKRRSGSPAISRDRGECGACGGRGVDPMAHGAARRGAPAGVARRARRDRDGAGNEPRGRERDRAVRSRALARANPRILRAGPARRRRKIRSDGSRGRASLGELARLGDREQSSREPSDGEQPRSPADEREARRARSTEVGIPAQPQSRIEDAAHDHDRVPGQLAHAGAGGRRTARAPGANSRAVVEAPGDSSEPARFLAPAAARVRPASGAHRCSRSPAALLPRSPSGNRQRIARAEVDGRRGRSSCHLRCGTPGAHPGLPRRQRGEIHAAGIADSLAAGCGERARARLGAHSSERQRPGNSPGSAAGDL